MWLSQWRSSPLREDRKKISLFVPSYRALGTESVCGGRQGEAPQEAAYVPSKAVPLPGRVPESQAGRW